MFHISTQVPSFRPFGDCHDVGNRNTNAGTRSLLVILVAAFVSHGERNERQSSQTEPELPNPLVMESLQSFESLGTIKKLVLRMIAFTLEAWQVR